MKLASVHDGSRDGALVVVSRDLTYATYAKHIVPTLQAALDRWEDVAEALCELSDEVNTRRCTHAFRFDQEAALAPLPRAVQALYGSAYGNRGVRVHQSPTPVAPHHHPTPMIYQGPSDRFLAPHESIPLINECDELDVEAELAVVCTDVTRGAELDECARSIRLLLLINDLTYRRLVPEEKRRGFGFVQAKPHSSCAPVAITPDELKYAWADGKVDVTVCVDIDGRRIGAVPALPRMEFTFYELLRFAACYRPLHAGTVLSSGTVSGPPEYGCCSLIELRAREREIREPETPYLRVGDLVTIDALTSSGISPFGAIRQQVVAASSRSYSV